MSYSIDSRTIQPGDIFIPVKGERFDGHDFIAEVLKKGADKVLDVNMQEYAEWFRINHLAIPVIGITGSAGKTTVKDLATEILSAKYSVHKTAENENNEVGVPLTLLNTPAKTKFVVCEMGMRGRGQILQLTRIARPNYVIISSIGSTHLELLGTRRNIALAKAEIYRFPKEKGHPYITFLNKQMIYFDLVRSIAEKNGFKVVTINEKDILLSNFKLVAKLAEHLKIPMTTSQKIYSKFLGKSPHRQQKIIWGSNIIVDDTYNANPESMAYAIQKIQTDFPDRPISIILGEMRELGAHSDKAHQQLIRSIEKYPQIQHAFFYGSAYKKFEKPGQRCYDFNEMNELVRAIKNTNPHHQAILVKGSRSMKMETIVSALTND